MIHSFEHTANKHQHQFHQVVLFDPKKEKIILLDFTESNSDLDPAILDDTEKFSAYINNKLEAARAKYGIGGYGENRAVYSRSKIFDADSKNGETRRIHLGIDIWGEAGTPVFAFMGGMVHSVGFNNHFGDYGATLILLHQLDGYPFYTLYGHISLEDINKLKPGQYVSIGQKIAQFGITNENGYWPPHLHFQVILEIGMHRGDFPGVCKSSEKNKWLQNSPDPDLILRLMQYAKS